MDTKRSQSVRKVTHPQASKVLLKAQSQASVTPSQTSEQIRTTAANAEKNPLDALSRITTIPEGFERRSGLQDVDENYLKRMNFGKPAVPRYEFAAGQRSANAMPQQTESSSLNRAQGGAEVSVAQQIPPAQSQAQPNPITMQQNPNQAQAAQQPIQPAATQVPNNAAQLQQQQQMQQQQQQLPQHSQYLPASGEPELYTTCPNCQTTIYMVRGDQGMPAEQHIQPEGTAAAVGAKQ